MPTAYKQKSDSISVVFYKREGANNQAFYSSTTLTPEVLRELIAKYPEGVQIVLNKVDKTKSKSENPPDLKAVFKEAWKGDSKGNAAGNKSQPQRASDDGSL